MEDNLHQNLIELESELRKLKKTVNNIESVEKSVLTAQEVISRGIEKIDKIEFHQKFENLLTNILNLGTKIDLFERNVKDDIIRGTKEILNRNESNNKVFQDSFIKIYKSTKVVISLLVITLIILISVGVILYLK